MNYRNRMYLINNYTVSSFWNSNLLSPKLNNINVYNIRKNITLIKGISNKAVNITDNNSLSSVTKHVLESKHGVELGKGYRGYDKSFTLHIRDVTKLEYIRIFCVCFLDSLDVDKIYTVLAVGSFIDSYGCTNFKSVFKESVKISKHSNVDTLAYAVFLGIDYNLYLYNYQSIDRVFLFNRVWLTDDEISMGRKEAVDILDRVFHKNLVNNKIVNSVGCDVVYPSPTIGDLKRFKQNKLYDRMFIPDLVSYTGDQFDIIELPYVDDYKLIVSSVGANKYNLQVYDKDFKVFNFEDTYNPETGVLLRKYNGILLTFKGGKLLYTNVEHNMLDLMEVAKSLDFNGKIGTIDIETYYTGTNPKILLPYSCAFAVDGYTKVYWLGEDGLSTSDSIIIQMIRDIFDNKLADYTFYAHNMGRFDGYYLIKTLLYAGFEVKPIIRDDNTILSIKISTMIPGPKGGKSKKVTLTIYDSILLLNKSLKTLGKDFKVSILKGDFPHNFSILSNLSYIGPTPGIEYYNNITPEVYKSLQKNDWSFKEESTRYLIKDVESLREILIIFATEIYDSYHINITNYKTLPGIAFHIYLSNFYNRNKNGIKIIKGDIEKIIRSAYYGGIVSVFSHEIDNGYYYDINSHYPNCMKEPMPIGNPVYTDNNNLNELFGFVRAKVIAPDKSVLKNPILPLRDKDGLICPRGEFYGWWFSEELKNAENYGYKVVVLGAYTFTKSHNLFDDYIEKLYSIKASSESSPSKRSVSKLLLNSLYGRMGMNEIVTTVKIVRTEEVNNIIKKINWKILIDLGDFTIIKYSKYIDPELNKLLDIKDFSNSTILNKKNRGVPSSVSIAAAITSYARIKMSKFLNNPDNECVYTDTDSGVFKNVLDPKYVGKELGQFKLEYVIKKGIFISPKTYAVKYVDPKTKDIKLMLKCKGVGSQHLSWQIFEDLLSGKNVQIYKDYFNPDFSKGCVNIYNRVYTISGVTNNNKLANKELLRLPAPPLILSLPEPVGNKKPSFNRGCNNDHELTTFIPDIHGKYVNLITEFIKNINKINKIG